MADISAKLVKELRERTSVGFMECKKALQETNGDVDKAEIELRKRGVSVAAKKAGREANEGLIEAYIHAGAKLGVMLELNCESDFVARTEDFQSLAKDIAMHVAATSPRFVRREEVDEDAIAKEREIQRDRAPKEGKPEQLGDKIVEPENESLLSWKELLPPLDRLRIPTHPAVPPCGQPSGVHARRFGFQGLAEITQWLDLLPATQPIG